jgi:hypothetical protein
MGFCRWAVMSAAVIAAASSVLAEPPAKMAATRTYQPPKPLPFELSLDMVTLRELVSKPATKAILESVDPSLANPGLASSPFGNYTVPQLRNVLPKAVTPQNIAKINTALAKLPRDEWPVP